MFVRFQSLASVQIWKVMLSTMDERQESIDFAGIRVTQELLLMEF